MRTTILKNVMGKNDESLFVEFFWVVVTCLVERVTNFVVKEVFLVTTGSVVSIVVALGSDVCEAVVLSIVDVSVDTVILVLGVSLVIEVIVLVVMVVGSVVFFIVVDVVFSSSVVIFIADVDV